MNRLQVRIFAGSTSTTEIFDTDRSIEHAIIESFGSCFPSGLYTTARLFVPRNPARAWQVKVGYRLAIYNGLLVVWEGQISAIGPMTQDNVKGTTVEAIGQWGALLESRTWRKVWADNLLTPQAWVRQPQGDNDNQVNIDWQNRISIGPQAIAWGVGEIVAAFRYTMPTGETIKRIVATLKNRESGQNWITRIEDTIGASTIASEAGDGVTTATDTTLGTPRQYVEFQFVSNAAQTPTNAYGRMSAVMVYSETGAITSHSVVTNVGAKVTEISSDVSNIDANAFALEPFKTNGFESLSSILRRVMAFGDTSYNQWAVYLAASDTASSPNGKPVLHFEQYPALTDYDLVVRLGDQNVVGEPEFKLNLSEVYNWIVVRYGDDAGNEYFITPNDDANLKSQASIDLYGERHLPQPLDAGTCTSAAATSYARRVLAAKKDAKYKASQSISVKNWIKTKQGVNSPVCRIVAGQRILISNSVAETPFLITNVEYTPAEQTARIDMGIPDSLAVYLAQRALLDSRKLT